MTKERIYVWADTAYRSQVNEAWLKRQGRVSRIHRKKPRNRCFGSTLF